MLRVACRTLPTISRRLSSLPPPPVPLPAKPHHEPSPLSNVVFRSESPAPCSSDVEVDELLATLKQSEDWTIPSKVSTPTTARPQTNPAISALLQVLQTPRAHRQLIFSLPEINRANSVWELYNEIPDKFDIPPGQWKALLTSVVPPPFTASHTYSKKNPRHLTGYLRTNYEARLHQVLKDKIAIGLNPDQDDYHFIMRHFAVSGYVKATEAVYRAMVARQIKPNEQSFVLRMNAISEWISRYQLVEGKQLQRDGLIAPFESALASVPPLVSEIMSELQAQEFTPALSKDIIDFTCKLFARAGDWDSFNLLARYGYGVDLDTPDAVPEEWIKRVQAGDQTKRGITSYGVQSMIALLNQRGQYWKALSLWETFMFRLPVPEGGYPKGLEWSKERLYRPIRLDPSDLAFMPVLPPTSALPFMNPLASSALLPDPSIASNTDDLSALLRGPTEDPNRATYLPLIKHLIHLGLAAHYTHRQALLTTLIKLIALPADSIEDRRTVLHTLHPHKTKARMKWFRWLSMVKKDLKEDGSNAREVWELLGWAEEEARWLRLALEADRKVVELAWKVVQRDQLVLGTSDPTEYQPRLSIEQELANITHEIAIYKRDIRRYLPLAQVAAAQADLGRLRQLLTERGWTVSSVVDPKRGTTLGERMDEYAVFLADRLPYELEPLVDEDRLSSPVPPFGSDEARVLDKFAGMDRVDRISRYQLKRNTLFGVYPSKERGTTYDVEPPAVEDLLPDALASSEAASWENA